MCIVSDALRAIHRVMEMDALNMTQTRTLRQAGDMMLRHIAMLSSTAQQPSLKAPRVLGALPPPSLLGLPEELLINIAGRLSSSDLARLDCCSTACHGATTPASHCPMPQPPPLLLQ